jgi:Fe-S-cluster containining protein
MLHPECGDVPANYLTVAMVHPLTGKMGHALQRRPNGECVYLGEHGCTIHDRAPAVCKEFDCRGLYRKMSRPERRRAVKKGLASAAVLARGRQLLEAGS